MSGTRKQNILIVDDVQANLFSLEVILKPLGVNILRASSGQEALKIVFEKDLDLIILDIQMPDMDGLETAKLIKGRERSHHIPIIFVAALNREDKQMFDGYKIGGVDYIFKPIDPEMLIAKAKVFLKIESQNRLIKEQAREIAERGNLFRSISSSAKDAIITIDSGCYISYWNEAAENMFGYKAEEIMADKKFIDIVADKELFVRLFERMLEEEEETDIGQHVELAALRRNGSKFPVELSASVIKIENNSSLVMIIRDLTQRKEIEKKLESIAYYDSLTGLPNRMLLFDRLGQVIRQAKRDENSLGLLFVDLDHFKSINDTLGHHIGDMLLKETANRLTSSVREFDTVARLGGDEFAVVFSNISDSATLASVAEKIIAAVSSPYHLRDYVCSIGASVGISIYPDDGTNVTALLKNADTAMYRAKEGGGNNYQFCTTAIKEEVLARFRLEGELRRAVSENNFSVYYQPQIDVRTRRVVGVEALVRWLSPEMRELVSPSKFIPLAEDIGLIFQIWEHVLNKATGQMAEWHSNGFHSLLGSVNISHRQFRNGDLLTTIKNALKISGLPPENLQLELTESAVMHDPKKVIDTLLAIKDMGIKIALDDFGTGHSSLSCLKDIPIDTLKIDRSFVENICRMDRDRDIVKAIIAMSHSLSLKVVAEGVEEMRQYEMLKDLGCDVIQGFLFGKPLNSEDFHAFVTENHANPVLIN
ncbi:MAG: EAL domain-containing protein [Nitrospinae bacterium]|nr:EAL domain-containing protein [Nitrospinota bacterium]